MTMNAPMTAADIAFHPIAEVFPLLEDAALAELSTDIREHGLIEPIQLHEGAILDGRNRFRACLAAGVEPRFVTFQGDDPVAFVISVNLKRRHLNESQRAMVAAKLANLPRGGDRRSDQSANLHFDPAKPATTSSEAARLRNVSARSVIHARTVRDYGAPNVQQAVERGEVSVSAAARAVRVAPKDAQATWSLSEIKSAVRRAAREAALGGRKLPTPRQAREMSRDAGGAGIIASDGKYHFFTTPEDDARRQHWHALRYGILADPETETSPEQAVAAVPAHMAVWVEQRASARITWLQNFLNHRRNQHAG